MSTRDEDYVDTLFTASTHDYIMFFTNFGRVYKKKGYMIPEAGRTAKGTNIVNIIPLQEGERVSSMIRMTSLEEAMASEDRYLVLVTRNGTVKRMEMSALKNIRTGGIRAITLDEDDELISVLDTDGSKLVLIATRNGMAICFDEKDIRAMGRTAAGVRGIKLKEGDYCVGAGIADTDKTVLSVTENGYGKRTPVMEYLRGGDEKSVQSRGGFGVKNYNITEKTGAVIGIKIVENDIDVLLISDDGTIIRMPVSDISIYKRDTQGVRLMRVGDDTRVIALALMFSYESDAAAGDGEE